MAGSSLIADMARSILDRVPPKPEDGLNVELWNAFCEAGLDLLLTPEDQGGAGDAFQDAVATAEALGRAGAAVPFCETVIANRCLAQAGIDIESGAKALVLPVEPSQFQLGDDGRVTIKARDVVAWAPIASEIVLRAVDRDGNAVLCTATLPSDCQAGETLAGEPMIWLAAGSYLQTTHKVPLPDGGRHALSLALVLTCAAMTGAVERVCELSISYANTRTQFGKPIARFQAIQHMAARLASQAAAMRASVEAAADALSGTNPLWRAAIAKARCSEAVGLIAADAHQIHGAIGYTREYELHRLTRRLWSWRECFGNEGVWQQRIGAKSIEAGSARIWQDVVRGMEL